MKPNIVYIHSHDTGRYVQPYGHAISTPRIQQFAEEGVLFRQAFCAGPTCSPSRAALLTGQFPHSCGMFGLTHRDFKHRLNDYGEHIVHTLRKVGYHSVLAGVQHIHDFRPDAYKLIGYDQFLGGQDNRELHLAHTRAAEFLDNPPSQPFFLAVGFAETHREFPVDHPEDDERYCMPPSPFPDTPETRKDMARFKASARSLDKKVATVLDAIDRNNLRDNTIVILTTDHGIAFPRMKCNLTDGGTGVMLMIRGPQGFAGGKVIDSLVSHVDIFPTLCDIAGAEKPSYLQGTSILPLVSGECESIRDEIFAEVNYHGSYQPTRSIRTNRYKYIKRFYDHGFLPSCDGGITRDYWLERGWDDHVLEMEMLYDTCFDPAETNNLVDHQDYQNILTDLRQRLLNWQQETNDPILAGPIPRPEGGGIYKPNCVSDKNLYKLDEIDFM